MTIKYPHWDEVRSASHKHANGFPVLIPLHHYGVFIAWVDRSLNILTMNADGSPDLNSTLTVDEHTDERTFSPTPGFIETAFARLHDSMLSPEFMESLSEAEARADYDSEASLRCAEENSPSPFGPRSWS